jgi:EAL domain-containing protein (putative c-di-GMP-specific phosphodiesterase class I)
VIAEGVEDDRQLSFLNAYGCNYGQGYLFGKPLDPAMFIELLRGQGA